MKRLSLATLTLICLMAVTAFAAGRLPYTAGSSAVALPIQNLTGSAPDKAASGCTTKDITKGTFGTYTTAGFVAFEGEVVTAAGAAEPVKWKLDGTQVAVGSSFKMINHRGTTYTTAAMDVYSSTSRSLTGCRRKQ